MTRDAWLSAHPYLQRVAELYAEVERALAGIEVVQPRTPTWDDYRADFGDGVPLLRSIHAPVDLEPGGRMIASLVGRLAASAATEKLAADARQLDAELRGAAGAARVVDWMLGDEAFAPSSPGTLRFLGWTAMARYLRPLVTAFAAWRDEERWLRSYCPTCGSPPAMAQLVGKDPGRKRFLACGCCSTRWQYNRTRCPFCEGDAQRLAVVTIEGEAGLRLDSCESCRGYLKTYEGEGQEALLLSDWSSLHLDLIAQDRGLKRLAASLYELEASAARSDR